IPKLLKKLDLSGATVTIDGWWVWIIAAALSGLVRVIILIILVNIRAGIICRRVLNLSVGIIPTHYRWTQWGVRKGLPRSSPSKAPIMSWL
ncbi:hypothetical protein C2W62_52620, partial [Candidatus Entotheonella serta]